MLGIDCDAGLVAQVQKRRARERESEREREGENKERYVAREQKRVWGEGDRDGGSEKEERQGQGERSGARRGEKERGRWGGERRLKGCEGERGRRRFSTQVKAGFCDARARAGPGTSGPSLSAGGVRDCMAVRVSRRGQAWGGMAALSVTAGTHVRVASEILVASVACQGRLGDACHACQGQGRLGDACHA